MDRSRSASEDTDYGIELAEVVAHLRERFAEVSVRGEGVGRSVHASSPAGSVELAKDESGDVRVEYRGRHDAAPCREATYTSYERALADIMSWIPQQQSR